MFEPFTIPMPPIGGATLHVVYMSQYLRRASSGIAAEWRPFYVGQCFFDQLLAPPDALANAQWIEIANDAESVITQVLFVSADRAEAERYRDAILAIRNYPANEFARPIITDRMRGRVRNDNTGEIYKNASAAALAAGCAPGQMSNHLKRMPSFNSIKGCIYSRIP